MKGISYVDDRLSILRAQLRQHPAGQLALPREALEQFAFAQYRDSRVWAGWFVTMRDLVKNRVLREALQHSLEGEVGDTNTKSHMTLCLEFLRSMGLQPSDAITPQGSRVGGYAEWMINVLPNLSEAEICGWIMGTEDLVPALFELFLPHFEKLGGINTHYLTEHIVVDSVDHAVELRKGCLAILSDPERILYGEEKTLADVLFGIELAGRFTLSVPDEMLAAYATSRNRATLKLAAAI